MDSEVVLVAGSLDVFAVSTGRGGRRLLRQRLIRDVWGRGIVHIKLIGDLPHGSGALEEARGGGLSRQVREQEP